ncbi:MAG: SCP2 sterol-binding domain-containing protein [Saprospiraceae bacterium]|uniref:SCP2 sterol-binding domain-containing protein n=1 Tax=Candidatus Opimibacter skivensis TaxID=2982028 RepID=A0A9D7SQX2_9BACT|nr:SCP2 sterol-binding domain-containing protein [Candidatus Opimibacter skivensis]
MTSREYLYALPSKVSPDAVEGLETIFHFDLDGESGGKFTVSVSDGKVNVSDGLNGEPKCVVRSTEETFNKLISGDLNPMMAVLTGKVKISNQGEMLRYAKLFGLM